MGCHPRLQTHAQRCPHIRKAEKLNEEATLLMKCMKCMKCSLHTISLCPSLLDAAFRQ